MFSTEINKVLDHRDSTVDQDLVGQSANTVRRPGVEPIPVPLVSTGGS